MGGSVPAPYACAMQARIFLLLRLFVAVMLAAAGIFLLASAVWGIVQGATRGSPTYAGPAATSTAASYNWAGYVAEDGVYTAVSGTWVVPVVSTEHALAADATWVGIGGVTAPDLIQAGTQALVDAQGNVEYQAWVERLPEASERVPFAVSVGGSVTVSVTLTGRSRPPSGGQVWDISFINNTTGKPNALVIPFASALF